MKGLKMTKTITKAQFREMINPVVGVGKDITTPKMQLFPIDRGIINGNVYSIKVNDLENTVELTKVSE